MERTIRNGPILLLAAALLAAAVVTLALTAHLTFFGDCWEFLMNRRDLSLDAVFKPHNEHIVVIPVLIEQASLRIFGMTSATPEFVLLTIGLLVTASLLFFYVKRRLGPWPALFATALVLFLGPAFEVLLWTFEISFVGSILFGLAMLLALERGDRRGDIAACLFLLLSFGFSSLGIPFAVAAAVAVLQGPRESWLRRAYLVAIPVFLYMIWYAGWGHTAESHLTLHNILASPQFVVESMAFAVGSLSGLGANPVGLPPEPSWGRVILAVLVLCFGYRLYRKPGVPAGLWPAAAAAATNWFLTAFNEIPGREPAASRYQYVGAFFVLMILANLLQGVRIGRRALLIGAAFTCAAVATNVVILKEGKDFFQEQTTLTRSDTAALEIARGRVDPEFALNSEVAGTASLVDVSAGEFFTAADEYGSPAYTADELAGAPELGRKQADFILSKALPITSETQLGRYSSTAASARGCVKAGGKGTPPEVKVPTGESRIEVAPGPPAVLGLRRFAEAEYPVAVEGGAGDSVVLLHIPPDRARQPWFLHVESLQLVTVCPG